MTSGYRTDNTSSEGAVAGRSMTMPKAATYAASLLTIIFALLCAPICRAQMGGQPIPTTPPFALLYPSINGTKVTFSFAQAFSSNWWGGDENIFALRLSSNTRDERNVGPLVFRNQMTIALGANYQDDSIPEHTLRVGDNDFFTEVLIAYPVAWKIDPYIAGSLRTPITESFRYFGRIRTRFQSLWDPVTSRQSTGFTYGLYGKAGSFNTRLGVALQQIRAEHHTQMTDDYTTRDVVEAYRPQSGVEFVNDANLVGDSTLNYRGRFTLFGSFEELDVWSVRWENETRFRIWKSVGITWIFNVVHDVRQTRRTQIKQSVMLGLEQDF